MQTESNTNATTTNNLAYIGADALRLRLGTDELIRQIKEFLEGKVVILQDTGSGLIKQEIITGQPKANNLGVQAVISRVKLVINPSYVQGNFDKDFYYREIRQIRMTMAEELIINIHRYEIDEYDYCGIIDGIMHLVKGFVSRLIENKERESYDNTVRHIERNKESSEGRRLL